jgi:hypothetical protein
LFEVGKYAKTIRNNTEIFILYRNYGDAKTNNRLSAQLELKDRFVRCLKEINQKKHGYWLVFKILSILND